ncbi:copper resistance protein NlpE N-terminal domain-containing protein [Tenacibaculum piscium]|uniref:copper resistance protein NlpE N-terminal domain-containing protein n=1 Tax=Tenacibaculum piscium TaxID=1458515 RepID=UPI0023B91E33|nr:copper resistance protein NlpE N-terminal domain-containing protein [Tenacibaculum piscium]
MNKLLYILVTVLLFNACQSNKNKKTVIDEHSAEYALDYQGVYKGTLPCADCSGIKYTNYNNE